MPVLSGIGKWQFAPPPPTKKSRNKNKKMDTDENRNFLRSSAYEPLSTTSAYNPKSTMASKTRSTGRNETNMVSFKLKDDTVSSLKEALGNDSEDEDVLYRPNKITGEIQNERKDDFYSV